MPTTAFRLISIEAKSHRKAARQKELQINHSTTILSSRTKSDTQLSVEIRYSVSYGLLGMVQLDCEVIYSDDDKNIIKSSQQKWEKEHKLPEKISTKWNTSIPEIEDNLEDLANYVTEGIIELII